MSKARDLSAVVSSADIADYVKSADTFGARITNNSDSSQGLQVRTSDNDTGQFILDLQSSTSATGTNYGSHFVVDKSGKCGIGTTAPLRQLHIENTSANSEIAFTAGTSGVSSILFGDGQTGTDVYRGYLQYNHSDDALLLATAATERMRIDSSGRVGINGSSNQFVTPLSVRSTTTSQYVADFAIQTNGYGIYLRNASDSVVGTIIMNASSTTYNTSSDYRLKENVTNVTDGITRVKQLAPKRFNFIAEPDTTVDGFLAHEVQTVVPEAITGTKDEVDDDGNAVMQGIDQSKLVPLLTAALQEAIAEIDILKTKVAALEAG